VIRAVVVWLGLFVVLAMTNAVEATARSRPPQRAALRRPSIRSQVPIATNTVWPRQEVLDLAVRAYRCGHEAGVFDGSLLTVIDYSLPSSAKRLWVLDLDRKRVLFHELVAHGENSGDNYAVDFSNQPGSLKSSIGVFRTEDVYRGGNGYSLRLAGLEPGVNDLAMERRIVMHGAAYVSPRSVSMLGRLGRSWGCPALPTGVHRRVIDSIKGGTAVFAYYPDARWLRQSRFLSCSVTRVASR
jgi:L,D-transpeptidase catalytic domain